MKLPWMVPPLNLWSIVGMNHYKVMGRRYLYVAMSRGGRLIKGEGPDEGAVFEELQRQARLELTHDPVGRNLIKMTAEAFHEKGSEDVTDSQVPEQGR